MVNAPSNKVAVSGTFAAAGQSNPFSPIAGRDFNVTVSGGSATTQLERSFDSGTTWFVVLTDALRQALPESFTWNEAEYGVQYRLNCVAYVSGTVTYRVSQ